MQTFIKYLLLPAVLLTACLSEARFRADLQDVPVHREAGYWVSEWQEFDLPQGLASFQILGISSENTFNQLTDLIAPDGKAFVSSDTKPVLNSYSQPLLRNAISPNRTVSVIAGFSSTIIPNNPALPSPLPGTWKFRAFFHSEPQEKRISFVILGKSQSEMKNRRVDIRLWIAKESYWSKDLKHLDELLLANHRNIQTAGLELRILSQEFLPEQISGGMKLPQDIVALAKKYNRPDAINVYLMPHMESQSKDVNGLACIAGPLEPSVRHNCFVSMYALAERADRVSVELQAKVMTHEIGHYLGLYHTVDNGYFMLREVFDPFPDTPESVTGNNMMDPGIHSSTPTFSPMQKSMLLLSPALQF